MDRRNFLGTLAALMVAPSALLVPSPAIAGPVEDFWAKDRTLWLKRPQSGEEAMITYWRAGSGLDEQEYFRACHMLRDVRANKAIRMSRELLDILYAEQGWLNEWGFRQPVIIHSGYRTPETNRRTEGSARDSEHLRGNAVDLHIPGVPTQYLGRLNRYMTDGGVGVYVKKNFVHVDRGRYRTWGA